MDYNSLGSELESLDTWAESVRQLLFYATEEKVEALWRQLDLSTIYHDWALEGQVVGPAELDAAFDTRNVTDTASLPLFKVVRAHKQAIDLSRAVATQKNLVYTVDLFREFNSYFTLNPEDARTGRYRKEIPLHRSYFHEICEPSKIAANMRKLVTWMNDTSDTLSLHPIKWAAKFHFRFMRVFPFSGTSGKVGRTVLNAILVRHGYLPAIIHATERQRYYEAIRQPQRGLAELIIDSIGASLDAAEKFLR